MTDTLTPVRMRIEVFRCPFCATTYLTREDAEGTLCATDPVPEIPVHEGDELVAPMPYGQHGRVEGVTRVRCKVIGVQPPDAFFQVPHPHDFNDRRVAKHVLDGLRFAAGTTQFDRYPHGWVAILRALQRPYETCNASPRAEFHDAGSAIVGPAHTLVGLHLVAEKNCRYERVTFTSLCATDDVSHVADRTPN